MRLYKCNYPSGVAGASYICVRPQLCADFSQSMAATLCCNCFLWYIAHDIHTQSVTRYVFVCETSSAARRQFAKGVKPGFILHVGVVLRDVTGWRCRCRCADNCNTAVCVRTGWTTSRCSQGQRTVSAPLVLNPLYLMQKTVFSLVT